MTYLLDTNTCIEVLNRRHPGLMQRFAATPPAEIVLCTVVQMELYYGAHRSPAQYQPGNLALLHQFFGQFTLLPLDAPSAEWAGIIRADLASKGTPIGPYDLLIAAIAVAHKATLVTHNVREFSRVAGLQYVDWQAGP